MRSFPKLNRHNDICLRTRQSRFLSRIGFNFRKYCSGESSSSYFGKSRAKSRRIFSISEMFVVMSSPVCSKRMARSLFPVFGNTMLTGTDNRGACRI